MSTAQSARSSNDAPITEWRERLERLPGVRFTDFEIPFLPFGHVVDVLCLAAGVDLPSYHRGCRRLDDGRWTRIGNSGAAELIEPAEAVWLESYWDVVRQISSAHHDLMPYYDSALGHPLLWKRGQERPTSQAALRLFDVTLWNELGLLGIWDQGVYAAIRGDARICSYGSWDCELFFPRANVERFASALSSGRGDSANERRTWGDELRDLLGARPQVTITEAFEHLASLPEYDVDGEGARLLLPDGQSVVRRTIENKLSRLRASH